MRDSECRQLFVQATHPREKTITRSAGEEKSGNRTGHNDCMFAASLEIDRPGRRRLCRPEAPLFIHEPTAYADAAEPAGIAPSHIQRQITPERESSDPPTFAFERDGMGAQNRPRHFLRDKSQIVVVRIAIGELLVKAAEANVG